MALPTQSPPEQPPEQTRVIFRTWRDTGEVIALFPDEPWGYGGEVASYLHVGQHGGVSYPHVIAATRAATEEEIAPLRAELTRIGYHLIERRRRRPWQVSR